MSELSGGMTRRVALARALAYPDKMIILDEPFTGLDKDTKREVIAFLLSMRKGRIVLAATHDEGDITLLGGKKLLLGALCKGGTA